MRGRRTARAAWLLLAAITVSACSAGTGVLGGSQDQSRAGNVGALPSLSVQQSDVPPEYVVQLYPRGDQIGEAVTLDLCSAQFPSEQLRMSRRQMAVLDAEQQVVFSTEAVAYRNAAATEQAFTELRAAQANCSTDLIPTGPSGTPLRTIFGPAPDRSWPNVSGVERLAYDMILLDEQGNFGRSAAVFLRRGRVLLGVYFAFVPDQPLVSIEGQTTVTDIVGVFTRRMNELPASIVNG